MRPESRQRLGIVLLTVAFEGGCGALALLLGWLLGQGPFQRSSWSGNALALGVAATLPMLGVLFVALRWPVGPVAHIKQVFDEIVRDLLGPCSVAELAFVSLMAGFGEEMLFRGVLQPAFSDGLGSPWAGLVVASLLFGLLHPITFAYVVFAAAMGFYLGCVWMATDNLVVVVVAHALYDFVALVVLLRGPARSE